MPTDYEIISAAQAGTLVTTILTAIGDNMGSVLLVVGFVVAVNFVFRLLRRGLKGRV